MFLDYRIYKLEEKIKYIEIKHHNISSGLREDDDDAQAYLRLLSERKVKFSKKLDRLKADRYRAKLDRSVGLY